MDTPSKERLVGAIIFVTLIVLLVPAILSGPRHAAQPANDVAAERAQMRTYTIELGNPVKQTPPASDDKPPALPPPPAAGVPPTSSPAAGPPTTPALQPPVAVRAVPKPDSAQATSAAMAAATDAKESWGAQLGSFSKAENAERLAISLRARGYRAFVSPTGAGSHILHRVRVGPEPTRAAAEALVARLKRDGESSSVVTLP